MHGSHTAGGALDHTCTFECMLESAGPKPFTLLGVELPITSTRGCIRILPGEKALILFRLSRTRCLSDRLLT